MNLSRRHTPTQASMKPSGEHPAQRARHSSASRAHPRNTGANLLPPAPPPTHKQGQQQEVWKSTESLFWDHMREVQNKWNTLKLNDDIWAKLIYFEQNRRLAKAYVSTPILTIDGSTSGLDGFRIGLSGIENSYRNLDSIGCLRSIGHGIKLKIDAYGNILVRKIVPPAAQSSNQSQCSIWIKEWPKSSSVRKNQSLNSSAGNSSGSSSSSSSSSSDYTHLTGAFESDAHWPMHEITDTEQSYKLFDMQKFRAQLERTIRNGNGTGSGDASAPPAVDWRQCVSIISFVTRTNLSAASPIAINQSIKTSTSSTGAVTSKLKATGQRAMILNEPCWLMLINIIAIDMLKSSICDTTTDCNHQLAPPTSPQTQVSAMVDRYTFQARASRAATGSSHALPVGAGNTRAYLNPTVNNTRQVYRSSGVNLRTSQSVSSLLPPASNSNGQSRGRLVINYDNDLNTTSNNQMTSSTGANQQQRALKSNRYNSSQQLSAGSYLSARASNSLASSSSSSNAIYTTFTGKYLDKQQRLALRNKTAPSTGAYTPTQSKSSEQQQQEGHRSGDYGSVYPIDSLVNGNHQRKKLPPTGSSRWRSPSPQVITSAGGESRQYSNNLGLGAAARRIPAANNRKSGELPAPTVPAKQLAHSLSAFDLSHGHKLNLRSLNTSTSIRMNFDSDDDEQEVAGATTHYYATRRQQQQQQQQLHNHSTLPVNEIMGAPAEPEAKELRRSRRALRAFNLEASEWANLAKKYLLNNNNGTKNRKSFTPSRSKSTSGAAGSLAITKSKSNGHLELALVEDDGEEDEKLDDGIQNSNSTISSSGASTNQSYGNDIDEQLEDIDGQVMKSNESAGINVNKQLPAPQKKVSRSSLASASSSSSSGCPENDYCISKSSSSMSSSSGGQPADTGTGDGQQELNGQQVNGQSTPASQPASSSGIVCSCNSCEDYACQRAEQSLTSITNKNSRSNAAGMRMSSGIQRGVVKAIEVVDNRNRHHQVGGGHAQCDLECLCDCGACDIVDLMF